MRTIKFLAIVCLALGLTSGAINAQTESVKLVDLPWDVFISCSGVDGEYAVGTLNLHVTNHFNKDGILTKTHSQPQGGELVGMVTGTIFNPTGVTQTMQKPYFENGAWTYTFINVYHMVGQGGVQYKVKTVYHLTITPDGEITAEVDNSKVECK